MPAGDQSGRALRGLPTPRKVARQKVGRSTFGFSRASTVLRVMQGELLRSLSCEFSVAEWSFSDMASRLFHIGRMIMEVEKRPCIWLPSCPDYSKKEAKEKAWEEICLSVFPGVNREEIPLKVALLRKKWFNIRDCYRRDTREAKKGEENSFKRKYIYSDMLHFLDPINLDKSYNHTTNSNDSDGQNACYEVAMEAIEKSESHSPIRLPQLRSKSPDQYKTEPRKRRKLNLEDELMKILKPKQRKIKDNSDCDAEKSFLLSFVHDFKNFNEMQKIQFRRGMVDLVQNIKFPGFVTSTFPQAAVISFVQPPPGSIPITSPKQMNSFHPTNPHPGHPQYPSSSCGNINHPQTSGSYFSHSSE